MLSGWPIRNKLLLGIGLLLVIVATLAASGSYGLYSYRGLVRSLRDRSTELPLSTQLSRQASDLRSILSELRGLRAYNTPSADPRPWAGGLFLREQFQPNLDGFQRTLDKYRRQLDKNDDAADRRISDDRDERETLAQMDATLVRIVHLNRDQDWLLEGENGDLTREVDKLYQLAERLPGHLHRRFRELVGEVRLQYRTAIVLTWVTTVAALLMFGLFVQLFHRWIFRPLRILIEGSRKVAAGNFQHRIRLETHDEMAELADAMNDMTSRFRAIRDDLDRQVQERTKQVVRSEQLASVGFLAAGVAHEINNPLASIALCSESLETRVRDLLLDKRSANQDSTSHDRARNDNNDDQEVISNYLRMIQQEAFRCKRITEKLLDFSKKGDVERHNTDLRVLVESVIDMVQHLGKSQSKQFRLVGGGPVFALVNAQEMKQVVLNLLTNGLDSLEAQGTVTVEVHQSSDRAELIVSDDGCGMNSDVLQHLFEPFYTRRRRGQGTGLGLSIAFRIVADHDGQIEAFSEGIGKGSKFLVSLPLAEDITQNTYNYAA